MKEYSAVIKNTTTINLIHNNKKKKKNKSHFEYFSHSI